jgi:hypothetical protein
MSFLAIRRAVRRLGGASLLASLVLAACVGDQQAPAAGGSDAGVDGPNAQGDAQGDTQGNPRDSSDIDGSDASSANDASITDAAPDADAAVACVAQGVGTAFFFTRSAALAATVPGGSIVTGTYKLTRVYDTMGGAISGSATIFTQGPDLYLQFYQLPMGGTASRGTKRIQTGASGTFTMTEVCAAGLVGNVETGSYEMRTTVIPNQIFINFPNRQEVYTHD